MIGAMLGNDCSTRNAKCDRPRSGHPARSPPSPLRCRSGVWAPMRRIVSISKCHHPPRSATRPVPGGRPGRVRPLPLRGEHPAHRYDMDEARYVIFAAEVQAFIAAVAPADS